MIDTHAHLQDEKISDYEIAINNALSGGVEKIICASSNIQNSKEAVKIATKHNCVYATIGIHPEEANSFDDNSIFELTELAKNKKVVAIGEIGLDYHYEFASRDVQKAVFEKQINLANNLGLPIVVHTRDASGDTMDILRANLNKLKNGVCIHCFNMSLEILKEIMSYNFYISVGGIVTFNNAKNVIDVVKECKIENLMLETDSPYIAPVPLRGTINEPKNVVYSARKMAEIRGLGYDEFDRITTQNAKRFFRIKD